MRTTEAALIVIAYAVLDPAAKKSFSAYYRRRAANEPSIGGAQKQNSPEPKTHSFNCQ